ncbi:N-ethylmaleimide reductase [compost metagenome]
MDAVTKEIGAGRVGIRLSPVTPANDVFDPEPQTLFGYVVKNLARYPLAYIHIIEGATGGPRDHQQGDRPFDYDALRSAYVAAGGKAAWMTNNGYDRALAVKTIKDGEADLVAFGKSFIANPDLVERLKLDAPLNPPDQTTFYGGGARGYTDYPALEQVA